ncbi:MAG TPA: efflux RND transporter periplasmic adaptor subunit [Bryobacteraceae bacterium]|nr:efflux RND transporter periplasmic adaptor subunit [Bryobacteraceae bacterium]
MTNRKRGPARWIFLGVLVVLAGVASFSLRSLGRAPAKIDSDKLATVERMDLARSVVATGKITPVTQVDIKSKASGIILKLPVNVGDRVKAGQVICELDQNDLLPKLRQSQAALAMAQAQLKSAQADYERNKVEAAGPDLPFLKKNVDRAAEMFKANLIAQNDREDAEKNYQLAVNKQQQAQVNLGVTQAAISRAEAEVEQAKAALSQSEEDVRNATIVSPMDGVVLSRDHEVGDAVSSILVMGSGATVIMTVGDLSEVYVKGKADESDIGKVYLGQPARITVEAFKDQTFTGKVTKISPMGVEKDNVTTFEVRVSISNESRKLLATMTANAEIVLEERKGVLAIPEGAIIYKKDHSTEAEVPDPTAPKGTRRVPIAIGISNGSKTEVVKGLTLGQQVVLQ